MSCVSSVLTRHRTDQYTHVHAHARRGSRPGSPKLSLSVCAACSVLDLRVSPGSSCGLGHVFTAALAAVLPAPRLAHAEHVLTSMCCAGRGGVGGQRTATRHHGLLERARVCRRTSRRHIGHGWGPTAVAVAVVEHQQPRARRSSLQSAAERCARGALTALPRRSAAVPAAVPAALATPRAALCSAPQRSPARPPASAALPHTGTGAERRGAPR